MMNDFDKLDDARIEDTYFWACPQCGRINPAVCGNDEVIECSRCGYVTSPEALDWEQSDKRVSAALFDSYQRMIEAIFNGECG